MDAEKIAFMVEWASEGGAHLETNGEVGFGRDCVGISKDNAYIDYDYNDNIWTPEDAYHKHDCLAVLGHGEDSLEQLYQWVKWLKENDWTIKTDLRKPKDNLDLLLHGVTTSYIKAL